MNYRKYDMKEASSEAYYFELLEVIYIIVFSISSSSSELFEVHIYFEQFSHIGNTT